MMTRDPTSAPNASDKKRGYRSPMLDQRGDKRFGQRPRRANRRQPHGPDEVSARFVDGREPASVRELSETPSRSGLPFASIVPLRDSRNPNPTHFLE